MCVRGYYKYLLHRRAGISELAYYQRMRFAQDGRNWFFSSREDDENVESLQTDGHTHRLLDGRKDIGPATGNQNTYKKN